MTETNFKTVYRKLIEARGLSPAAAKEILKAILRRLGKDKEKRHEML